MTDENPASYEASALIEEFLAANPQPTPEQWKVLILANPKLVVQIADAALAHSIETEDAGDALPFEEALFNATRSAMLNEVESNTAPVEAAKLALKRCRGPAARQYAREIGLGDRVDLFNQMVGGETYAPLVLMKRLAAQLHVRIAAMAEVFSMNFQNQPVQAFKTDGKPPGKNRKPVSWSEAVKAAGVTGEEAARLLHLEKELD